MGKNTLELIVRDGDTNGITTILSLQIATDREINDISDLKNSDIIPLITIPLIGDNQPANTTYGDFTVTRYREIKQNGELLRLQPQQRRLLLAFLEDGGEKHVLTGAQIMNIIWGEYGEQDKINITRKISSLNGKIKGGGYKITIYDRETHSYQLPITSTKI